VIGIDNGFFYIDPQHAEKMGSYMKRVEKFIVDACAATETQGNPFCAQMLSLIPSYAQATGFNIPEYALPYIQHGILRGLVQIAQKLTDEKLTSIVQRVSTAVVDDWCNIWTNSMKSLSSSFVADVLGLIRSHTEILQKALRAFDQWTDGCPVRVLVMQSKPCSDVELAATQLEEALRAHPPIDIVLYPEGWNTFYSFSAGLKADFSENALSTTPLSQIFSRLPRN
jgi:hypothetical protein